MARPDAPPAGTLPVELLEWGTDVAASLAEDLASLAGKQPLSSELTAIAAVTGTAFGRALLALADAAALRAVAEVYSTTETDAAITAAIDALLDGAPGALDTLNELAAALGDDANFASTVTTALAGKQAAAAYLSTLAGYGSDTALAAALVPTLRDTFTAAVWLPANRWSTVSGAPSLSHINRLPMWSFDQTSVEGIGCGLDVGSDIPASWATADAQMRWTTGVANTGEAAVWRLDQAPGSTDTEAIATPTTGTPATVAAPSQNAFKYTTIATGLVVPDDGDTMTLALWRLANDAADLLAGDAAFAGIRLTKAS